MPLDAELCPPRQEPDQTVHPAVGELDDHAATAAHEVVAVPLGRPRVMTMAVIHVDVFDQVEPRQEVHSGGLDVLRRNHVPTNGLRPKHFSTFDGQPFDYVITLCDRARERCPTFERAEMMHWTFIDPAAAADAAARRRAFDDYFAGLSTRLRFLIIVDEKA